MLSLAWLFAIAVFLKVGSIVYACYDATLPKSLELNLTNLIQEHVLLWGFTVPVIIMGVYCALGWLRTLKGSYEEKLNFGDSCYYLGFLFTISAIIMSLVLLGKTGHSMSYAALASLFGAAMFTTLLGMLIRIMLVTFGKDEQKKKAEKEWAEAMAHEKAIEDRKQAEKAEKELEKRIREYIVTQGLSEDKAREKAEKEEIEDAIRLENPDVSEDELKNLVAEAVKKEEQTVQDLMKGNKNLTLEEAKKKARNARRPRSAPPRDFLPNKKSKYGTTGSDSGADEEYVINIETDLTNLGRLNDALISTVDHTEQLRTELAHLGTKIRLDSEHNSELISEFLLRMMEDHAKTMQEAQASFTESMNKNFDNLNAQLQALLDQAAEKSDKQIKENIAELHKFVESSVGTFTEISSQAVENVQRVADEGVKALSDKHKKLTEQFENSVSQISQSAENFNKTQENINSSITIGLHDLQNNLQGIVEQTSQRTDKQIGLALDELQKVTQQSVNSVSVTSAEAVRNIQNVASASIHALGEEHSKLAQHFEGSVDSIARSSNNLATKLNNAFVPTVEWDNSISQMSARLNHVIDEFESKTHSLVTVTEEVGHHVKSFNDAINAESNRAVHSMQRAVTQASKEAARVGETSQLLIDALDNNLKVLNASLASVEKATTTLNKDIQTLKSAIDETNNQSKSRGGGLFGFLRGRHE